MKIAGIVNEVSVEFHDELNPALWQDNDIKLDVQVKLLEIAKKFVEYLKVPNLNIVDVYFMGSNAAYVYTKFSDIDLHIIVDDPDDRNKELYDAKKRLWNEQHNISIKGYDVELYVQDIKEPNASMGIYSLLRNKWVVEPERVEADIDDASVQQKFKHLANVIDHGVAERDIDSLNKIASDVRDMRKSGLQRAGEFSVENLAFKELRNGGYLEKLSTARQELEDEAMSLDETLKKVKGRWALVSRKNPSKVLQYYKGSGHPSKEWVSGVERRVHSFSEGIDDYSGLDKAALTTLINEIKDLQDDIDSDVMGLRLGEATLKALEHDYKALEAIHIVAQNNLVAVNNKGKDKNNYFLYKGDVKYIQGGFAAIHFSIEGDLAHVRWLGSYNESGKSILQFALEKAKSMGAKKVKVDAKWQSEGFYTKQGFNVDPEHKESDPFTKAVTGGTTLMSKEINELDDRSQRLKRRRRIRKSIGTNHVYRYEENVLYNIKRLAQQRSIGTLINIARKIWDKFYKGSRKMPTIRFGKGDTSLGYPLSYTEGYSLIELAPGQQDILTLIHELVHAIGPSLHGPSFTKLYYEILKDYLPKAVQKEVYDELVLRHGQKLKPYYKKMLDI